MSITKYTNFTAVNEKTENEGQFLQADDFFIITKNEKEEILFGDCKYDVMEVSVYDINNNLLPQKSGNNVAYIKSQNIADYMYNVTNAGGQKELAINAEKLLNDLGFTNGILKLNINFVRNVVGSENELERVWIQEISPSREEVRILPLKTTSTVITEKNNKQFDGMNKLTKDFIFYKKEILDKLDNYEINFLEKIDTILQNRFGEEFFNVLKTDFGLSKFTDLRTKIFREFKTSVTYYLENKYYTITDSNFGQPSAIRFESCEKYDFNLLMGDIQSILSNCIDANMGFLKRRDIPISSIQKEFQQTELSKQILNTLESFNNPVSNVNVVFNRELLTPANVTPMPINNEPVIQIVEPAPIIEQPIDLGPPIQTVEPIEVILPAEPITIIEPTPIAIGGGGGGFVYNDRDLETGLGRERLGFDNTMQVENIQ